MAWIAAGDPSQPAVVNGVYPPRMPNFVASSGSIPGLTYNWKLQVTFHDRYGNPHRDFDTGDPNCSNTNAQIMTDPIVNPSAFTSDTPDQVNIPSTTISWRPIAGSSPWNIYQDPAWTAAATGSDGFFGWDPNYFPYSADGMDAYASAVTPPTGFTSGSATWTQVMTAAQTGTGGVRVVGGVPQAWTSANDGGFPYGSRKPDHSAEPIAYVRGNAPCMTYDGPGRLLMYPQDVPLNWNFSAGMFYMWKSGVRGSIWVPLRAISWGYNVNIYWSIFNNFAVTGTTQSPGATMVPGAEPSWSVNGP